MSVNHVQCDKLATVDVCWRKKTENRLTYLEFVTRFHREIWEILDFWSGPSERIAVPL